MPENELKAAICKIHEVMALAREFKNKREFTPSLEDLQLFEQLSWNLWTAYSEAESTKNSLENRYHGVADTPNKPPTKFQWVYRKPE